MNYGWVPWVVGYSGGRPGAALVLTTGQLGRPYITLPASLHPRWATFSAEVLTEKNPVDPLSGRCALGLGPPVSISQC